MFKRNRDYILKDLNDTDLHRQIQFKDNLLSVFDNQRMLPLMCSILNGTNATDPRIILTPELSSSRSTYYVLYNLNSYFYNKSKKGYGYDDLNNFTGIAMMQLVSETALSQPRYAQIADVRIVENTDGSGTASLAFDTEDKYEKAFAKPIQDFEAQCQSLFIKIRNQIKATPLFKMLSNEELTSERIQIYCNKIANQIREKGFEVDVKARFHQSTREAGVDLVLITTSRDSKELPHFKSGKYTKLNIWSYSTLNKQSYVLEDQPLKLLTSSVKDATPTELKLDQAFKASVEQVFNMVFE